MPDITMCSNKTCPLKEKCYRFMATPDARQSYAHFPPQFTKGVVMDSCEYFMPMFAAAPLPKEKR